MSDRKKMEDPGAALFECVESAQGSAFLSDGLDGEDPEAVLGYARASLYWTNVTANKLRGFIRRLEKDLES